MKNEIRAVFLACSSTAGLQRLPGVQSTATPAVFFAMALYVCLAAFGLLVPSWAMAVSPDDNTVTSTGVSGFAGTAADARTLEMGGYGITEIAWREHWDKPCWLQISGKDPDKDPDIASLPTLSRAAWICPGGGSPMSSRKVFFEGNPRYFVRGISVCTNDRDNHRLKGIKIVAASLPVDGHEVQILTVTDKATHPHCATWHPTVYCPANHFANGLNLKVKDEAIVGLGLRCVSR